MIREDTQLQATRREKAGLSGFEPSGAGTAFALARYEDSEYLKQIENWGHEGQL